MCGNLQTHVHLYLADWQNLAQCNLTYLLVRVCKQLGEREREALAHSISILVSIAELHSLVLQHVGISYTSRLPCK